MASKVKDAVVWYQKKVRSCFYGDVLSLSLVVLQHHVCGSVTLDFFFCLFCFCEEIEACGRPKRLCQDDELRFWVPANILD